MSSVGDNDTPPGPIIIPDTFRRATEELNIASRRLGRAIPGTARVDDLPGLHMQEAMRDIERRRMGGQLPMQGNEPNPYESHRVATSNDLSARMIRMVDSLEVVRHPESQSAYVVGDERMTKRMLVRLPYDIILS